MDDEYDMPAATNETLTKKAEESWKHFGEILTVKKKSDTFMEKKKRNLDNSQDPIEII